MLSDSLFYLCVVGISWIIIIITVLTIRNMMVLFNKNSLSDTDVTDQITDEERERIKSLMNDRQLIFSRCFAFGCGEEPSLVLDDFLFLGNIRHASDQELLTRFDIKHIINVCDLSPKENVVNNFDVIHIPMQDDERTNIKQHFDRTNELLHGYYEKKERCLVHCAAGVSRSATIVLAYLMKYHHNTLKEAFFFLCEKRPQIWPNNGFLVQLIRYEKKLISSLEVKDMPNETIEEMEVDQNPFVTLNEFEQKHKKDE